MTVTADRHARRGLRPSGMALAGMLLFGIAPASATQADGVAIYRCTDAAGALTVQNMPCPKGSRQEIKRMQGLATVPMAPATPAPMDTNPPASTTPPAAASGPPAPAQNGRDEAATDHARRLPPPHLFRCTASDATGSYLSEDSTPPERCVPLRTVGLDGNPEGGAGQACEVVRDVCARVPDEGLCEAWQKRHDEAEVAWRFTRAETAEHNQAEFQRVQRILAESTCGQ